MAPSSNLVCRCNRHLERVVFRFGGLDYSKPATSTLVAGFGSSRGSIKSPFFILTRRGWPSHVSSSACSRIRETLPSSRRCSAALPQRQHHSDGLFILIAQESPNIDMHPSRGSGRIRIKSRHHWISNVRCCSKRTVRSVLSKQCSSDTIYQSYRFKSN